MFSRRSGSPHIAEHQLLRKLPKPITSDTFTNFYSACIGSLITGWLGEKIGKKLMLLIAFVIVFIGTTLQIVSTTNQLFFVAKFIGGFSIGIGLSTIFSYMGEIAPLSIRGILTASSAVTFVLAQLIVALILNYQGNQSSRWAYRGLFLGQYVITGIACLILPFMPEHVFRPF